MNWNPALLSEVQQVDSQMGSQLSGSPRNSTKPPIRLGSDFVRENPTIFFPKNDIFMTIFHDIPLFEDVFSLQNKIFAKKGNLSKKKQAPRVFRTFFILKIRDLSLRELGERWFTWDVIDAMLYTYGWWKTFRGHFEWEVLPRLLNSNACFVYFWYSDVSEVQMLQEKKSVVILARYSLAIEEGVNGARVVAWKTASDWSTPKVAYVEDFFRRKQGSDSQLHFSRSILTYCSWWLKSHPKRMGLFLCRVISRDFS